MTRLARVVVGLVGLAVIFAPIVGPQNLIVAVFLLTVCTVGVGLVFLLLVAYAVGWVILELVQAASATFRRSTG
jgi:hypothetical protein